MMSKEKTNTAAKRNETKRASRKSEPDKTSEINAIERFANQTNEDYNKYNSIGERFDHFLHGLASYAPQFLPVRQIINTAKELDAYYDSKGEGNRDNEYFYRGEGDAAWICRSTLLREYREKIKYCSKFPRFANAFEAYVRMHILKESMALIADETRGKLINNNQQIEIAIQHYGRHTSLIDFTEDKKIALYFASENYDDETADKIDYIKVIEIKRQGLQDCENVREGMYDLLTQGPYTDDEIDDILSQKKADNSDLWDFKDHIGYIKPMLETTNKRIIHQKGVLLCLGGNRASSLEEVVEHCNKVAEKNNYPKDETIVARTVYIHTSLVPYLLRKLKRNGITKEYIYPED